MPESIVGHDASSPHSKTTPMTTVQLTSRGRITPRDDEIPFPKKRDERRKLDKNTTEYRLKSFVAGGLAGCAVRLNHGMICCAEIITVVV
jgi:hypothetical protein